MSSTAVQRASSALTAWMSSEPPTTGSNWQQHLLGFLVISCMGFVAGWVISWCIDSVPTKPAPAAKPAPAEPAPAEPVPAEPQPTPLQNLEASVDKLRLQLLATTSEVIGVKSFYATRKDLDALKGEVVTRAGLERELDTLRESLLAVQAKLAGNDSLFATQRALNELRMGMINHSRQKPLPRKAFCLASNAALNIRGKSDTDAYKLYVHYQFCWNEDASGAGTEDHHKTVGCNGVLEIEVPPNKYLRVAEAKWGLTLPGYRGHWPNWVGEPRDVTPLVRLYLGADVTKN